MLVAGLVFFVLAALLIYTSQYGAYTLPNVYPKQNDGNNLRKYL
jgi:hypothetical protein